ncbi:MAG TPA: monovalent cation/H+ antiporter subunit D family protein [Euryarchaeota archaeon]|nr:hydrogenase-4 component B [archaeon BMS3Bbin16]HDH27596.1 monovalent cation/H+ antiporter subunit D family protein [Euryarchaeota archaeon]
MGTELARSILPLLVPWIPALAAPVAYVLGTKSEKARDLTAIIACFIPFVLALFMIPGVLNGKILNFVLLSENISPLPIEFMADPLSLIVILAATFAWFLATIYATQYMTHEHARNRFYFFWLLTAGATFGVFLSKNLFTLFINFEILSLASWVLVIHSETKEAMEAGKKYLFMGIAGGLFLLFGVIMTYVQAGSLDLTTLGLLKNKGIISQVIFYSYIIGFGVKAGMFPVHVWLPDAHPVAPAPASALLSGVMIKAGAYGIIRTIYNVFGPELVRELGAHYVLAILASAGIILGSAVAIPQGNLKRMLAYSSIAMMGYIILGATFLTGRGLEGSVLHLFGHVFMKDTLFLAAGALMFKLDKKEISDYKGIGRKMPITMTCFTIAALSMIGLPPFVGFISKWFLVLGALDVGGIAFILFVIILLNSSLMNAVYYMPIIVSAFFGEHDEDDKVEIDEAPLAMLIPMVLLALAVVIFGIFPNLPLALIKLAVTGFGLT